MRCGLPHTPLRADGHRATTDECRVAPHPPFLARTLSLALVGSCVLFPPPPLSLISFQFFSQIKTSRSGGGATRTHPPCEPGREILLADSAAANRPLDEVRIDGFVGPEFLFSLRFILGGVLWRCRGRGRRIVSVPGRESAPCGGHGSFGVRIAPSTDAVLGPPSRGWCGRWIGFWGVQVPLSFRKNGRVCRIIRIHLFFFLLERHACQSF